MRGVAAELVERFRADLEALAPGAPSFGVAVSGGPDSLALLLLAHAAFPGRISAATVDHGLRAEAADEARTVGEVCAGLRVPHAILAARVEPAGEGIQAAAREARYRLLGEWAAGRGLDAIATAHHADDQAETFLMRAARGSGVAGLAGVRARNEGGAVPIVRPLLGWRKAELERIVADAGLVPADDPANADERHDRTRFRRLLEDAPALDSLALAASAGHLADAEAALAWTAARLWDERVVAHPDGALSLDPSALPAELLRRLLVAILRKVDPAAAPRGADVVRLAARLAAGEAATLAGVKASGGALWRFERAPPRRGDG